MDDGRYICHNCKKELEDLENIRGKVGFRDQCPHCYGDLHCCMNCKFHDPSYNNECRDDSRAFIRERDESNFCASFVFRRTGEEDPEEELDAKAGLNDLFDL